MRVVYEGPSHEVIIPHEGAAYVATNGEPVEVPDVLGRKLIEQEAFRSVVKKKSADPAASVETAAEPQED